MIFLNLISYFIGIFAEQFNNLVPNITNNRFTSITYQFKLLLSANYKTCKKPVQYASMMNISTVYLNEAVKNITGVSVTQNIINEIILQAQRFLYHTDMSIKEIAAELGDEDYAYFTRLFTKNTKETPSSFRHKYLK